MRLIELVALVEGTFSGSGESEILDAKAFRQAGSGDVTFLDDPARLEEAESCAAAALIVPLTGKRGETVEIASEMLAKIGVPVIQVRNVHTAFTEVVKRFRPPVARPGFGVHPQAILGERVTLGENVTIFPGAYVGNEVKIGAGTVIYPQCTVLEGTVIGEGCTLFPGVTVYERCVIGKYCTLHSGAVIGAYGFGYVSDAAGHKPAAQLGNVVLGDYVDVGANTTIDRGTYGPTTVGDGTKLDNLVMIGHNCQIGRHNLLCSQVGIAGSTSTGDFVVMGGQVGVRDHVHIATGVTLAAQAGVTNNITEPGVYLGAPAVPAQEMKRLVVAQRQLPDYWKTLKKLAKQALEEEGT